METLILESLNDNVMDYERGNPHSTFCHQDFAASPKNELEQEDESRKIEHWHKV